MKEKITVSDYLRKMTETSEENVNKVFNLDDDALNFSSLAYSHFSNYIKSSKSFEAVLKSDLKRIENFKEKFDLEKFKQRSKIYKKLADYWHKEFDENFFSLIKFLKKYMKFPYRKIPNDFPVDITGFNDNIFIVHLYFCFLQSTARGKYCFDKYFDRFNFNYDIDTKTIKEEIDSEITKVFAFNTILSINLYKNLPFDMAHNLKKYFGSGKKLKASKKTKYKLVAEYITIMEKHFKKLTGIQRIACELAGENQYSFSAWKNAKNQAERKRILIHF